MAVVSLPQVPQQDVPFSDPGSWTWNDYFVRQKQALELAFQQISGGSSVIINSGGGFLTPYDFKAAGNGIDDDTLPLQKWLDATAGGTGYLKAGLFSFTDTLVTHSNTTIFGDGMANSQLLPAASMSNTIYLRNEHDNLGDVHDRNINFRDFAVNGVNAFGWPISFVEVAQEIGAGGFGYALGDTVAVLTGGANAIVAVTGETGSVVTSVALVSGGTGYYSIRNVDTTASGSQPGAGSGLQLRIGADRNTEILALYYLQDSDFCRFMLTNTTYRGLNLYSPNNLNITRCVFDNTANGIDILTDSELSISTKIIGNDFRNNPVTSIAIEGGDTDHYALNTVIEGNTFRNQGESFIFSAYTNVGTVVNGNTMHTNYRYYDNGTGVEMAGSNIAFTNNTMLYSAWNCLNFFVVNGITVTGNQFYYPGQQDNPMEPGNDPSACIKFYITSAGDSKNITCNNNICVSDKVGTTDAIRFRGTAGVATQFHNVQVGPNMVFGSNWRTDGGVVIDDIPLTSTSVFDASCRRIDNWATSDCDPFLTHVLMNAGGGLTVTGCPFRPRTASIYSTVVTPANILFCLTEVAPNLVATSNGNSGNNDSGVARFYNNTGDTPTAGFAIDLRDGTGVVVCQANVSAYTQDGLIITPIIAPTSPVWLTLTLRP